MNMVFDANRQTFTYRAWKILSNRTDRTSSPDLQTTKVPLAKINTYFVVHQELQPICDLT